ncbi:Hypothetical_protein [Hexamita inflata]|uniref:Hypothetical_protein n=1 Tax=Hexamita inflata TaxID=28002 RepID=A0ABP1H8I4_9EUKA
MQEAPSTKFNTDNSNPKFANNAIQNVQSNIVQYKPLHTNNSESKPNLDFAGTSLIGDCVATFIIPFLKVIKVINEVCFCRLEEVIRQLQLWEVELLFLVYYVSNYILKYFATSNADDKFQQIISSWRLFMNYSLTQEGQKYDFDRIRPQSTIQSRYLIFQKGKIEITTCNKRTAMTKINAVEDVQGRSTNSLNKLRQF